MILEIIDFHTVVLKTNHFIENNALEYIIYASNFQSNVTIKILSNTLEINNITYINSQYRNGAMIYLENPGSILIQKCSFLNNTGFSGTSIYYFENQNKFLMTLNNNNFENNFAAHGAAGIYFNNKFEQINPFKNNTFKNNVMFNVESPPFKFRLNYSNIDFYKKGKISLNLIPGISNLNLIFKIVDYYGNYISYYNESMVKLLIQNKEFSMITDNSIRLEGITLVSILNGNLNLIY